MSTRSHRPGPCITALGAAALALTSFAAAAHPGHEQNVARSMFQAGLLHPLTGLDHLLAMVAVGIWAALSHDTIRQAVWTPVSFLCLLLVGALLGMAGLSLPGVEPVIMASLLVFGLLLASRAAIPGIAGAMLVGFFALFHGMAHGSELPTGAGAMVFIAGFMLSTLFLHGLGLAGGVVLKRRGMWLTRAAGAGIALYGASLLASAA